MSHKKRFQVIAGNCGHYNCNCRPHTNQPASAILPTLTSTHHGVYAIHNMMPPVQVQANNLPTHSGCRVPQGAMVPFSVGMRPASGTNSDPSQTQLSQTSILNPPLSRSFGCAGSSTNSRGGLYNSFVGYNSMRRVAQPLVCSQDYPMVRNNSISSSLGIYQKSHDNREAANSMGGPPLPQCQGYHNKLANTAENRRSPQSRPVLILWDVENVQVPRDVPVTHAVYAVRTYVQHALNGNSWFETDFAVACDVFRHPTKRVAEMNDAQITVIHVNSMSKNAADMKLKSYMHKFATMFSQQSACVVLISGDVNFAPELHLARHHAKLQILLLHNHMTPYALREIAHYADDFYRVVMSTPNLEGPASVWTDGVCLPQQQQRPLAKQLTHIVVANLPEDVETNKISKRLLKLTENTGGRVVNVRGSLALMKFPSSQNATRALARITERDVCGHRVLAYFVDGPGSRSKSISGRPNTESSKSVSTFTNRESHSSGEPTHSNTSSDSADTPCALDRSHEAPGDSRSLRISPRADHCLRESQLNSGAFDSACTIEPLDGQADSSPCGTSSSGTRDDDDDDDDDDSSSHCSSQLCPSIENLHERVEAPYTYSQNTNMEDARGRSLLSFLLPGSIEKDHPNSYSSAISLNGIGLYSENVLREGASCTSCTCEKNDLSSKTKGEINPESPDIAQPPKPRHSSCIIHHGRLLSGLDASAERQSCISHFDNCEASKYNDMLGHDLLKFEHEYGRRHASGATFAFGQTDADDGCAACTGTSRYAGSTQLDKKAGDTRRNCLSAGHRGSSRRTCLYGLHHTRLEKTIIMLAYVVYKILNKHQLLSSSLLEDGKYSDADEQKATVLSLDYDSYMDLQCISAGNIPRTNGVESLLNHVGASIVFTLMGFPGLAEAGFRSPSRIKISSNQRFSSMQLAKRFLKLTTSSRCLSVALPDVLKALPIATRINCFQEIVQEMAEMLLATQSADMYYSAKVLTGLDTTWRRDFIQRWILQLVNNSDNTRTLDPIRALERCRRLPKTIDEFEEKTTAENRQNFSLRQATALGGPDVAIVLAFFMASPKPLSLNELETRFLKLRGATLPLSAVHILHEMGAIQTVPFETRNRGTENASPRFDVQEFCRIVRGLIRQMNHDPNAVYYLTLATGKNALPCLPYSCTRRRSIACLLEKYGVSQFPDLDAAHMLEDFAAFFEKLQLARDDKVALADCYNGYRLRECVVFPRRVPDKENINGTKSCSAEENCNRKHKHLSQTALQASGNSEQQRPTTATKGRRALRLAAIFPY